MGPWALPLIDEIPVAEQEGFRKGLLAAMRTDPETLTKECRNAGIHSVEGGLQCTLRTASGEAILYSGSSEAFYAGAYKACRLIKQVNNLRQLLGEGPDVAAAAGAIDHTKDLGRMFADLDAVRRNDPESARRLVLAAINAVEIVRIAGESAERDDVQSDAS